MMLNKKLILYLETLSVIMKAITFTCLLFSASLLFAQDYNAYYEGINKAKRSLLLDSLEKATHHYFETFQKFDFVFARDCFNALELASNLREVQKTDYFLRRCLTQGIDFDFLQEHSILADFKKSDAWPKILSDKDSLWSVYERNVNWEIRSEINAMFAKDQEMRDLADKHRFNIFKRRKLNKQLEELDRKLVLRMIEITKQHGFPGEKLIGLDVESMHPKIKTKRLTTGMPIVILIHHYSQPNALHNTLLLEEVTKGNLLNEHFATISDFRFTYGKPENKAKLCYSLMFKPKLDLETIDSNRVRIHLLRIAEVNALKKKKLITPRYYLY